MEYLGTNKPVNIIQPLVSVCVPTYNHERYIRQCLDGILMQKTDFPFEVLVGEDASTDNTRAICKEYAEKHPDKIRLFLRKKEDKVFINGKPSGKMNNLMTRNAGRGKYMALCDGDDYWTDPEKLQKQAGFLENHPEYVLAFHDARIVDESDHFLSDDGLPENLKTDGSGLDMIGGKWLPTLTVMFRNVLPKKMPEGYYKVLNGDAFIYTLLGHHGGAKYISGIKESHYRKHSGGIWSALNQKEKYKQMINTRKNILPSVHKKYKWAVRKLLFVDNVSLTPYVSGVFPKMKQYFYAYQYFVFKFSFLQVYAQLHLSLLKKGMHRIAGRFSVSRRMKKTFSNELIAK